MLIDALDNLRARVLPPAAAVPPWQQPMGAPNTPLALMPGAATAHGGAQMVPSSAAQHNANPGLHFPGAAGGLPTPGGAGGGAGAGGGLPLAPWEAALVADAAAVAAAGGKEKAGNAEINPVAVSGVAVVQCSRLALRRTKAGESCGAGCRWSGYARTAGRSA